MVSKLMCVGTSHCLSPCLLCPRDTWCSTLPKCGGHLGQHSFLRCHPVPVLLLLIRGVVCIQSPPTPQPVFSGSRCSGCLASGLFLAAQNPAVALRVLGGGCEWAKCCRDRSNRSGDHFQTKECPACSDKGILCSLWL